MERMELLIVEEREGRKPWFHKVGVAWPSKQGDGYVLNIPPGVSITGRVLMRPPLEKRGDAADPEPNRGGYGGTDLDDNIPF